MGGNRVTHLRELAKSGGALWSEVNFSHVAVMFGGTDAAERFVREVRAFDRSVTVQVYPEGEYVRVKLGLGTQGSE